MSTTPNTLPGQQITGNEGQDVDALIKAEVERLYKEQQTQLNTQSATQTTGPEGKIKLKVFGNDAEFDSPEAASKAIEAALAQVRDQTAALIAQQNTQGNTQAPPTEADKAKGFDRTKFAEVVAEDPLKGIDYALSHLLFNGQVESASEVLRQQLGAAAQQRNVLAAYQFREQFPSFEPSPRNVQALDSIRQNLGLAVDNPDSWAAAYSLGVARGIFQPPAPVQQQQQAAEPPSDYNNYNAGPVAPPAFGRSAAAPAPTADWLRKAEEMPTEQLEKLLLNYSGYTS